MSYDDDFSDVYGEAVGGGVSEARWNAGLQWADSLLRRIGFAGGAREVRRVADRCAVRRPPVRAVRAVR